MKRMSFMIQYSISQRISALHSSTKAPEYQEWMIQWKEWENQLAQKMKATHEIVQYQLKLYSIKEESLLNEWKIKEKELRSQYTMIKDELDVLTQTRKKE